MLLASIGCNKTLRCLTDDMLRTYKLGQAGYCFHFLVLVQVQTEEPLFVQVLAVTSHQNVALKHPSVKAPKKKCVAYIIASR